MITAILPGALRPIGGVELRRFGSRGDGGYWLPPEALVGVDWIVSLGLGDNWTFEQDATVATAAPLDCYDPTVTPGFWARNEYRRCAGTLARAVGLRPALDVDLYGGRGHFPSYWRFFHRSGHTHRRRWVGTGPESLSLAEILSERPRAQVLLKSDIEGGEWHILEDIVAERSRIPVMAVEFHSIDVHLPQLLDFLERMPEFAVVHVSANNWVGVNADGLAPVVEVTLAQRRLLSINATAPVVDLRTRNTSRKDHVDLQYAAD